MSMPNNKKCRLRYGNRFVTDRQLKKIERLKAGIRKIKIIESNDTNVLDKNYSDNLENEISPVEKLLQGRRFTELGKIATGLVCDGCAKDLRLKDVVKETLIGVASFIHVKCMNCFQVKKIATGKAHTVSADLINKNSKSDQILHQDINELLVLASIECGIGVGELNRLLAILNMPQLDEKLYQRYLDSVGSAIHQATEESCAKARQEERKLVIEKMKEVCEELPQEVSKELYPFMFEAEKSDSDDTLDAIIPEFINIIVSYDMGWSRRSTGRCYDSLNGYGTIIGFLSGRVLDYRTRNRKCASCHAGIPREKHDCRLNHVGSAKSMESQVAADLVNNSNGLKNDKLIVRAIVGDDDASAIDKIQKGNPNKIFKFSDPNHLNKNVQNAIYEVRSQNPLFTQELKVGVVNHIVKLFKYAVAQNKKNAKGLAEVLLSIPDHLFGDHKKCLKWCSTWLREQKNDKKVKVFHTVLLKNENLHKELNKLFQTYANVSERFCIPASSQKNESLHNLITKFFPKNKSYSKSKQGDIRVQTGITHFNDGFSAISSFKRKLQVSPGKFTKSFVDKKNRRKNYHKEKQKTKPSKARRMILKNYREKDRKIKENKEGTTYSSNCGILMSTNCSGEVINETGNSINQVQFKPDESNIIIKNRVIIYYDFETTDLEKDCDIIQIAAKSGLSEFSTYVTPTKNINPDASDATLLTNKGPILFYKGKEVLTISLQEGFTGFYQFLLNFKMPVILIAHNGARFDNALFLRAIQKLEMKNLFKEIIFGFAKICLFRS